MRNIFLLSLLALPLFASATSLHIVRGDMEFVVNSENMGDAVYSPSSITILGQEIPISEISRMYVSEQDMDDNTVSITYDDSSATVMASYNIMPFVTATVNGAHVTIIQSPDVNESTGEITYSLSGSSSDGSFNMEGSYKASIELRGLNLMNPAGSPFSIKNGKRISISAKNGSVNRLEDGNGSQKGALSCTGHLEFKGKGTLTVVGNVSHAIYAKEYVEVKNLTLNITGAKKDGINCCQYFLMESGEINISGVEGDGIQTDYKDSIDREDEDTGMITVKGGKLNVEVQGIACKGLKAEGVIDISGGDLNMSVSGNGQWDESKSKTKASACIGSDDDVIISGGNLSLTATGSGGKGLSCDGNLEISGGIINVTTSGGMLVYSNGKENHNYTGNTDRIASDMKSSPKGLKADGNVVINGGNLYIKTTGYGAEGIESKANLTINDGIIDVYSKDDCINSSNTMTINGGDVLAVSTSNDGLDANGNMYLNGGTIRAFGAGSPECGIDVNSEEGYVLVVTGGYILGVGGNNSIPTTNESTQPYLSGSLTVKASTPVTVSADGETIASFDIPEEYTGGSSTGGFRPGGTNGSKVFLSVPGMENAKTYTMTCGTSSTNVTSTLKGSNSGGRPW